MSEELNFETYEDALETAALAKMEINEIFKPSAARQRKLWKAIFNEKDASKFDFAKKLMFYQAGIPKEDSKSKMESFRKQISAMVEIMTGLGLEENMQSYFQEVGIHITLLKSDKYDTHIPTINEKITNLWDMEYFGEEIPTQGKEILKKLMDSAKNTEFDIVEANQHINEEIMEIACAQFDISPTAFKKALDLMVSEKNGKNIQEKLDAIEEGRKALDKALEPFTAE